MSGLPPPSRRPPAEPGYDACRRLVLARLLLVGVQGAILLLAVGFAPLRLPLAQMGPVLGLQLALVLFMAWRIAGRRGLPTMEAFAHLLADAAAIATLVYFSGGYANPFISLLLVPLILAAALFRAPLVWAMTVTVAVAYTLLMDHYLPLALEMTDRQAVNLHLAGMWLNFLITAGLIALTIARLTASVRAREAELAEARERALRDERLFALGTQAAAAAHDLATPLATLGLSLDELAQSYAGDDELAPALGGMAQQVARMRQVLAALRAAAQPSGPAATRPADAWLAELLRHWREMRPGPEVSTRLAGRGATPALGDEPLLNAALVTLLNNAADASEGSLDLELDWDDRHLAIEVLDRGPGLERPDGSTKAEGWGVGLQLARAAIEHLGGGLDLLPRVGGGLRARLRLPLPLGDAA